MAKKEEIRHKPNTDLTGVKITKLPTVKENIGLNDPVMQNTTRVDWIMRIERRKRNKLNRAQRRADRLIKKIME